MKMLALSCLTLPILACASAGDAVRFEPPILPAPVVTRTATAGSGAALPLLRIELLARRAADEQARSAALSETPLNPMSEMDVLAVEKRGLSPERVTQDNAARLEEILRETGRPTAAEVGPAGLEAFAALCLRTVHDLDLGEACLDAVEDAAQRGELAPRWADRMHERLCARAGSIPGRAAALGCKI